MRAPTRAAGHPGATTEPTEPTKPTAQPLVYLWTRRDVVGLVPWDEGSGGPCRALAFW